MLTPFSLLGHSRLKHGLLGGLYFRHQGGHLFSGIGEMATQHSLEGVVHEKRLKLKMTQQHFGAIGGANADAQYKYERGSRIPKTDYW